MKFIAVDVETSNFQKSSICQIGLVVFENGKIQDTWTTLINPNEHFEWKCTDIHGINENDVVNAPTIPDVYEVIKSYLENNIVVSHMSFDHLAFDKTFEKHGFEILNSEWLDSARIARRTWEQFSKKGYGLANLAQHFNISFKHHDALEDARVCGLILLEALKFTGKSLNELIESS